MGCKAALVFFNYFIMANFFWLLVEGLYLHALLLVIHSYSIRLSVYMLIGWGTLATTRSKTKLFCAWLFFTIRIFLSFALKDLLNQMNCEDLEISADEFR